MTCARGPSQDIDDKTSMNVLDGISMRFVDHADFDVLGNAPQQMRRLLGSAMLVWFVLFLTFHTVKWDALMWVPVGLMLLTLLGGVIISRVAAQEPPPGVASKMIAGQEGRTDGRIVCFGNTRELERLRGITCQFFEPVVIRKDRLSAGRAFAVCIVLAIPISAVLEYLPRPFDLLFLGASFPVALYGVPLLRLRCYRICPGRLEIMEFPLFRHDGRIRDRVDLRKARITCKYHEHCVIVAKDDEDMDPTVIDLRSLSRRNDLVETIFRAALCDRMGPDLPENELIG